MTKILSYVAVSASVALVPLLLLALVIDAKFQDRIQEHQFRANLMTVDQMTRELDCMTRNIYYEAAHEPVEGKLAVAQIVMNRVASADFPDSVCKVVHQRTVFHDRVVCQFTWLCDGSVQRHGNVREHLWSESRAAAKKVLLEGWRLPSLEHALYYHADYVNPRWRLDRVIQIGRHIFYQPRNTENI